MNVLIFKPSRSAMQSGLGKTHQWVLMPHPVSADTSVPVMGWSQSSNTLNQVRLEFPSKRSAIAYAENHGLDYIVAAENKKKIRPQNYMDNFKYIPDAEEKA